MPETQDIYISKKLSKILELFTQKTVTFSQLMIIGWYKNPYSAMATVSKLISGGMLNVALVKSTFIKL